MKKAKWLSILLTAAMIMTIAPVMVFAESQNAAEVNGVECETLQEAVDKAVNNGGEVTLLNDITLNKAVEIPAGSTVVINGDDKTISLSETFSGAYAAFNNTSSSPEGLQAGTTLTINKTGFKGHTEDTQDHAVIIGGEGGVTVTLSECTFTNLYDAVYCNFIKDPEADVCSITIEKSSFENVANYYGVDDGYTENGRVDKHEFTLTDNSGENVGIETFSVAAVDGVGYMNLADAVAAVENAADKTLTLRKDVELDSMLTLNIPGMILDLNTHTISGSDSWNGTGNDAHLIDITADNIEIKNGTLSAGQGNNHTLNIWNADGVKISDLTLDNSGAGIGGAPLIVGASDVTVSGTLTTITGANSWYAINVDSRVIGEDDVASSLTVAQDAAMTFEGSNPVGIYMENTAQIETDGAKVSFGENVTVSSEIEGFIAVAEKEGANATIENPENAGLVENEDGTLAPCKHETTTIENKKDATCTEEGYTGDEICTVCGEVVKTGTVIEKAPHNYVDGVCTVCGAEDPDYTEDAPAIIAGADSEWESGSKDGLSFTSDAEYDAFVKVMVDGEDLDEANYTVSEGSTVVVLNASYLETLEAGEHTIAIVSENGTAETTFTITKADAGDETPGTPDEEPPQTSDNNILFWTILTLTVGCAAAAICIYGKKRIYSK